MKLFRRSTGLAQALAGVAALALVAAYSASSPASAGQCPAGKLGNNALNGAATAPKDVADNVLSSIDLSNEAIQAPDRQLRLRRLEIKPGGVVPMHSHGDRPAIIYIIAGEVTEYASTCQVPIVHKAGEVAPETNGTAHWWKNTGKKTVVLLSADIHHDPADNNM